jgi:nitroimidazol reductase NimA-like FMN-containing flavoprotein (pyridoxamine 5'-phosphate oxidase superfamily)
MRLKKSLAKLIGQERVSRVATVDQAGMPHCVPVCQVAVDGKIYFASGREARKALNLRASPRLALTVDLYSDDWSHLRGVMVQGTARLIPRGREFNEIRARLYDKYRQYADEAALDPSDSVIVELTPARVFSWGLDG